MLTPTPTNTTDYISQANSQLAHTSPQPYATKSSALTFSCAFQLSKRYDRSINKCQRLKAATGRGRAAGDDRALKWGRYKRGLERFKVRVIEGVSIIDKTDVSA